MRPYKEGVLRGGRVALATIQSDTHKKFRVVEYDIYRRIQNTEHRIQNI